MMFRLLSALALTLTATACFSPSFKDCEVRCSSAMGCPDGLRCGDEGRCRASATTEASCRTILDDASGVTRTTVLEIKSLPNRDLDLLFVIDDSPSMLDKQEAVKAAFPTFLQQLTLETGLPNLHVGVVSSDMGTKGSAVAAPGPAIGQVGNGGCSGTGKAGLLQTMGAAVTDKYLSDIDAGGTRMTNYTGELVPVFRQMMSLGGNGCGFEQQLHAMRTGLSNIDENAGFLRPTASLGVIVVTDEDDCSLLDPAMLGPESAALGALQSFRCFKFGVECAPDAPETTGMKSGCKSRAASTYSEDIAPFQSYLLGLKPDPRQLLFGVFGGVPTPVGVELRGPPSGGTAIPSLVRTCSYTPPAGGTAVADPAIRLDQLVKGFPGRARYESLCAADLAPALAAMGRSARKLVGDTCLELPIALPANCVVEDTRGTLFDEIRACTDAITDDCHELVEDAVRCTDQPHHLKLVVRRSQPPPDDAYTLVRCTQA